MRNFKKISAIVLVVAMLFSMMSISVFAADSTKAVISLKLVSGTTDTTEAVEKSTIKTMQLKVYLSDENGADFSGPKGTYGISIGLPAGLVSAVTNDEDSEWDFVSYIDGENAAKPFVSLGSMGSKVSAKANEPIATLTMQLNDTKSIGTDNVFYIYTDNNATVVQSPLTVDTSSTAKVKFVKAFEVATVDAVADQTAELGDKVADVKAKLANLDVAVKGSAADETATLKATWDCAELADAETITAAKDYTFTGTLQGTDVVTVPEGKTATVKVTVGKIALTDAMVTSTYKNIEIPQTETAATLTAEQVIAQYVGDEYKVATISKNGAFKEEDATVAWAGTGSIDTSVLTSTTASNTMILTGTVTPKADGNYTGTAKTADVTVTVVPAEIKGGSISINNPIDNGYVTANITVPASEVAKMPKIDEDKDDEAAKAAKKAKRTVLVTVESKKTDVEDAKGEYEFTNDDIDKAIAAVTAATAEKPADPITVPAIKVDKKMKDLGYSSSGANKTFTVNVTVGGTKLLNGDSKDAVTGEVKKASSSSAPGINKGSSTTTTYAVTVVETKNGTATVSPEKAASGATVTVKPEPAEGYKVKSVTAVKADGTNVPVDEKAYTFTMPASAVKVTVEFEEGTEPVDPKPQEGKFADVADDFWAAKDIYTLKDAGIIGGKSATEFDPEGDVTRAEFAKMVVGLFGYKATSDAVNFEDCKAEDWFTPYVAAGVEAGVIKGVSDTEFAPNATITREDACTILGRALNKVAQSNELKFTDADKVAEYAAPYVALLSELGYVNGYEDGSFAPTNNITRAEAAKIIAGIYNANKSAETVTDDKTETDANADAAVEEKVDEKVEEKTDEKAVDKIETEPEK